MIWVYILLMAQSVAASIAMAINYHTLYWSGLDVLGIFHLSVQSSNVATFGDGVWIGMIGAWYIVSQILPLTVGRSRSAWAVGIDMISSIPPIAEMGTVVLKYFVFGGFAATAYQIGAMKVWAVIELGDVLLFIISFYLLMRAVGVVQTVDTK